MTKVEQVAEVATSGKWKRYLPIAMAVGFIFASLMMVFGWALAAPSGAAADDDFHQTSIWCPDPYDGTCPVRTNDKGQPEVEVPALVSSASGCYSFDWEISGACTSELEGKTVWTSRLNYGHQYPGGYYKIMHLLVGDNVYASILAMRCVN
ncbi:MAG: hypothetical protein LBE83_05370, partial [Propionibacteriaceae bacterium]|nr:hypothetical protein [Propionibacteriaceae bacterium]